MYGYDQFIQIGLCTHIYVKHDFGIVEFENIFAATVTRTLKFSFKPMG